MRLLWLAALIGGLCMVSAVDADDGREHYRKGLALAEAGEYGPAIVELQEAVKVSSSDADAYYTLGMLLERTGKNEEALDALLHAVELNPVHASALFGLALLYEELDLADKAIAAWQKFIAVSNDRELLALAKKHIRFLGER